MLTVNSVLYKPKLQNGKIKIKIKINAYQTTCARLYIYSWRFTDLKVIAHVSHD